MTDEPPEASQYTLSAAHNLYILSPSEERVPRCVYGDENGGLVEAAVTA